MNQTIIIIISIIGFIAITATSVFIYFQNQSITSTEHMECFFATDSLLNYLRNPHCEKPIGVGVLEDYQCAVLVNRAGYVKVECEDPQKAWVENGCLYIRIDENNTKSRCV